MCEKGNTFALEYSIVGALKTNWAEAYLLLATLAVSYSRSSTRYPVSIRGLDIEKD